MPCLRNTCYKLVSLGAFVLLIRALLRQFLRFAAKCVLNGQWVDALWVANEAGNRCIDNESQQHRSLF